MQKRNNADPKKTPQSNSRHFMVLAVLGGFWLLVFLAVLVEHARSWAKLLPLIGVLFILYAAFATIQVLKKR